MKYKNWLNFEFFPSNQLSFLRVFRDLNPNYFLDKILRIVGDVHEKKESLAFETTITATRIVLLK